MCYVPLKPTIPCLYYIPLFSQLFLSLKPTILKEVSFIGISIYYINLLNNQASNSLGLKYIKFLFHTTLFLWTIIGFNGNTYVINGSTLNNSKIVITNSICMYSVESQQHGNILVILSYSFLFN